MKKNKQAKRTNSTKKTLRKDIELRLISQLKELTGQLGQGSKKITKEIEKGAKKLAKNVSREFKLLEPAEPMRETNSGPVSESAPLASVAEAPAEQIEKPVKTTVAKTKTQKTEK
jgi:hypothetical protein